MTKKKLNSNEFQCAHCLQVFPKEWSDDEAAKEAEEAFGYDVAHTDGVIVCDDCYRQMLEWKSPQEFTQEQKESKYDKTR